MEEREWPWQTSAKGNPMTRYNGRVAVVVTIRRRPPMSQVFKWSLSPIDNGKDTPWVFSDETFDTVEQAKRAALVALGVRKARTPVAQEPEAERAAESTSNVERRIIVD